MSKGGNSEGVAKLIQAFRRVASHDKDTSLVLDLGTIQSDRSLLTDSFPVAIPTSDYLVSRVDQRYSPGTRVLVAWVGVEPIVISGVVEASEVSYVE